MAYRLEIFLNFPGHSRVKFLVALIVAFHVEICFTQEAKQLWERIQERQGLNKWRPDLEEEYEDQEGNIYNKKTYTDLQRQGLI